jgi:Flp pilus assembly protein TadD
MAFLAGCAGSVAHKSEPVAEVAPEQVKLPPEYLKAKTLMEGGYFAEAIPVLEGISSKHPEEAGPYVNMAIAYRSMGQLQEARQALERAMQKDQGSAVVYHQLGILLREQGSFQEAQDAYERSLQLNGDYALAHRNLGILYDLYLQQPQQALLHYRKYMELAEQPEPEVGRWVADLERRNATDGGTQ